MRRFVFILAMLIITPHTSFAANDLNLSDGAASNICFTNRCRVCESTKKNFTTASEYYLSTPKIDERLTEFILRENRLGNYTLTGDELNKKAKSLAKEFHGLNKLYDGVINQKNTSKANKIDIDQVNKDQKEVISFYNYCYGKTATFNTLQQAVININNECSGLRVKYKTVNNYDQAKKVTEDVLKYLEKHKIIIAINSKENFRQMLALFATSAARLWSDVGYHLGFQLTSSRICFGRDTARQAMYEIMASAITSVLQPKIQELTQQTPTNSKTPKQQIGRLPAAKQTELNELEQAIKASWDKRRAKDPIGL